MEISSQHTSGIIVSIIEQIKTKGSITLHEIITTLGERAFGMSILLFCIPNCLPIPNVAGLSALTGIPIIIIGLQMIIGRSYLWFPLSISQKKFSSGYLQTILEKSAHYVKKTEILLHPRLQFMSGKLIKRILGIMFVLFATIMSLPIPFGNFLPGLAMALMAIGIIEHDGLTILIGMLVGALTTVIMFTAASAILTTLQSLIS